MVRVLRCFWPKNIFFYFFSFFFCSEFFFIFFELFFFAKTNSKKKKKKNRKKNLKKKPYGGTRPYLVIALTLVNTSCFVWSFVFWPNPCALSDSFSFVNPRPSFDLLSFGQILAFGPILPHLSIFYLRLILCPIFRLIICPMPDGFFFAVREGEYLLTMNFGGN